MKSVYVSVLMLKDDVKAAQDGHEAAMQVIKRLAPPHRWNPSTARVWLLGPQQRLHNTISSVGQQQLNRDVQLTELAIQTSYQHIEAKKQSSCSIHLVNKTDEYVAFKVKTTSPKRYCVRPNIGVILPRATCVFTVTMQAQKTAPPDLQIKDKFLVQTTAIPAGITDEGTIPAFFSKETRRYVEENKLRVVLVSATQPEAEQLISGLPNVKTAIEVPVAKETLNIVNEVPNVVNQVPYSLKASFPSLRESPAILSEIHFPVNEIPTVQGDFPVPLKEAPATSVKSAIHLKGSPTVSVETQFSSIETNMSLKETPTVLRDFPVLLKEGPTTSAESAIRSKGSPTVSVETQFSSTEMNRTLKNTRDLRDFRVPLNEAPATSAESAIHLKETQYSSTEMRSDIFVNTENLHSCRVEDVQNMKSELINLEGKLEEAENLIMKLREEARITIQDRDKLRHEMIFRRKGGPRKQAGFPPLFVAYIAILGVSLGYLLHL